LKRKARSICSGLKLSVSSSIRFVKQHDYSTDAVKHSRKPRKAPSEETCYCFRLGDDLGGGLRDDVAKEVNTRKKNGLSQAHHNRMDNAVERCGKTIGTETLGFLDVVQSLCQTKEQVVTDHYPGDLDRIGGTGYCVQQKSAYRQHRAGEQNLGSCFSLNGPGLVDNAANEETNHTA